MHPSPTKSQNQRISSAKPSFDLTSSETTQYAPDDGSGLQNAEFSGPTLKLRFDQCRIERAKKRRHVEQKHDKDEYLDSLMFPDQYPAGPNVLK
jgi:hypothetical protein